MGRVVGTTRSAGDTQATTTSHGDLEVHVLEGIQAVERDRWNTVVRNADCASVFHRHEWLTAVETGTSYQTNHLLVEKDGNPIGCLPNAVLPIPNTPFKRVSSLYPGFGGPLATTDETDVFGALLGQVSGLCAGRRIVHEIRVANPDYLRYATPLREHGYRPARVGGRFVISLDRTYEAIREEMSRSRRRAIEEGSGAAVEIREEGLTPEAIDRFHDRYRTVMDRVDGHAYSRSFLEALREMESRVLLLALYIEGEYAGGFLELLDDEQAAVHGFFAAVPREYFDDNATELLYDYVLRWAARNGYDRYDFGGCVGDFREGSFQYKESFGGQLVPNVYWERGQGLTWRAVRRARSLYWRFK